MLPKTLQLLRQYDFQTHFFFFLQTCRMGLGEDIDLEITQRCIDIYHAYESSAIDTIQVR